MVRGSWLRSRRDSFRGRPPRKRSHEHSAWRTAVRQAGRLACLSANRAAGRRKIGTARHAGMTGGPQFESPCNPPSAGLLQGNGFGLRTRRSGSRLRGRGRGRFSRRGGLHAVAAVATVIPVAAAAIRIPIAAMAAPACATAMTAAAAVTAATVAARAVATVAAGTSAIATPVSCLSGIVRRDQRDADDSEEDGQGQSKHTIHDNILSQNIHGEETTPSRLPPAANLFASRVGRSRLSGTHPCRPRSDRSSLVLASLLKQIVHGLHVRHASDVPNAQVVTFGKVLPI